MLDSSRGSDHLNSLNTNKNRGAVWLHKTCNLTENFQNHVIIFLYALSFKQ